jgi:8-oxo-dGTP pyrophosphatase MutT (NUDIX family)
MSFCDHIAFCNSWNPANAVPLLAGGERVGWLRRDNARLLAPFGDVFAVGQDSVRLVAAGDVAAVSRAVDQVVDALTATRQIPKWRNETFDVAPRWGMPPVFRLDRGAVPFFGTRAYGVHLNGWRRIGDAMHLWIGRRAPDKRVDPDKLDNVVAGGIGNGHGVVATLVKEAEEEAAIPHDIVARARPAGAVSYRMETELGIRDDVLFVYDLEMPADFVPRNHDGEIVEFALMPAAAVLDRIRHTRDFKFNVNLVILDFAVRHGLLAIDDPEYLDVATGLHRRLDKTELSPLQSSVNRLPSSP